MHCDASVMRRTSAVSKQNQELNWVKLLDSSQDGKVDLPDNIAKVGMALGFAFLVSKRRRQVRKAACHS